MNERKNDRTILLHPMFLTLLITGAVVLLVLLLRNSGILSGIKIFVRSLQAFFIGIVFAYFLNPAARYFEKKALKLFSTTEKPRIGLCKAVGIGTSVLIFLGVAFILIGSIVPQLVDTVKNLIQNSNSMVRSFINWLSSLSESETWQQNVIPTVQSLLSDATGWLGDIAGQGVDVVTAISNGILSLLKLILNMAVGLIIAVYILVSKEKLIAQVRKLIYSLTPVKYSPGLLEILREGNRIFEGYLVGKLIDSLIIGAISVVAMVILRLPYALLISAIICVTNMIPFFGPYIGAFFGVLLILMVNPIQAVYFIIFVLILQQADGNVIGPRILGNSTGLDPMWIVVAVMAFGGIFGFVGMILGVPVFAWIYYIVKRLCEHLLSVKGMPIETENYYRGKEAENLEHYLHGEQNAAEVQDPAEDQETE